MEASEDLAQCIAIFPSLQRRGGRDVNKMLRSYLSEERTGWSLTRKCSRRTDHPVCACGASTPRFQGGERAKTNTAAAFPGLSSGTTRRAEFATSEGPVVTATYCLPPIVNVMG